MLKNKDNYHENVKGIISEEIERKSKPKINQIFLAVFLSFCLLVVLSRIVMGILLDMGFHDGKFHIGYWTDVEGDYSFKPQYEAWKAAHSSLPDLSFDAFLKSHPGIKAMIDHHPFTFWWLTQFTWLTTLIVIFFLIFRLLGMKDRIPKWLRWIASQNTISHVATWDLIVACFFWGSLSSSFTNLFSESLYIPEMITTICVHGIIPFLIVIYAAIYLVKDKKASRLQEFFAVKGLVFPGIYSLFYLILTIVWYDPYNISTMHDALVSGGVSAWASQLWMLPAILLTIYIFLGITTLIHNFLITKYNKFYSIKNDYEANERRKRKLKKIKRKIIIKEIKRQIKENNA